MQRTLHPGFTLELFRDQAEGYYLNLSSGAPVWFVVWRIDDDDPSRAWPETVSLSYNEAGRWLDAQERVDNVPLAPELVAWLQAYTDEHYRPEPKKRRRPQSFVAAGASGNERGDDDGFLSRWARRKARGRGSGAADGRTGAGAGRAAPAVAPPIAEPRARAVRGDRRPPAASAARRRRRGRSAAAAADARRRRRA